jgi:hypothetical protein
MYPEALHVIESQAGASHPLTVRMMINLSVIERRLGNMNEAERLAARAVQNGLSTPAGHRLAAEAMTEQAHALRRLKRKREARSLEKSAAAIHAAADPVQLSNTTVDARLYTQK